VILSFLKVFPDGIFNVLRFAGFLKRPAFQKLLPTIPYCHNTARIKQYTFGKTYVVVVVVFAIYGGADHDGLQLSASCLSQSSQQSLQLVKWQPSPWSSRNGHTAGSMLIIHWANSSSLFARN
jgi:hypothetical protein